MSEKVVEKSRKIDYNVPEEQQRFYSGGTLMMASEIHRLDTQAGNGNEIYIKRDDLLPFSMGGNKVRIAQAFYRDMKKKSCDAMIIYGSRHSNLCRVLSNLCYSNGVDCTMICSHEENEEETVTNNMHLIDWTGVRVVHCQKQEVAGTVGRVMQELRDRGFRPYYIYGDKFGKGNEGTAAMAYADAYHEIRDYEQERGWEFDYIFCPSGTGATQSGLICGHLLVGDTKKIMGIMISSRETDRAYQVILQGIQDYFVKTGQGLPEHFEKEIILLDEYRQGGYGLYDDRVRDCIRTEYCQNGLPLDPVYTGKAFWGMKKYILDKKIENSKILFLHTGGTPLFYDFLAKEGTENKRC